VNYFTKKDKDHYFYYFEDALKGKMKVVILFKILICY